jgi:hypothetical protein
MTLATKIAEFRKEAEDLIKAVVLQYYFDNSEVATPYVPYVDVQDALDNIGDKWWPYMTVNVAGVEMWFLPDGSLVDKVGSISLVDGSVTLAKMANVASGTVFYRKTAGSGPPEVQTLATLAADLDILTLSLAVNAFVLKQTGYSLVANTEIAKIHSPGSDDQDLSGLVEKIEGYRLASEEELAASRQSTFTIILPAQTSIPARLLGEVTLPDGWSLAADTNPADLKIMHGLQRRIAHVSIYSVDGPAERLEIGNAAYSGIIAPSNEILIIEALATIVAPIIIHLTFA